MVVVFTSGDAHRVVGVPTGRCAPWHYGVDGTVDRRCRLTHPETPWADPRQRGKEDSGRSPRRTPHRRRPWSLFRVLWKVLEGKKGGIEDRSGVDERRKTLTECFGQVIWTKTLVTSRVYPFGCVVSSCLWCRCWWCGAPRHVPPISGRDPTSPEVEEPSYRTSKGRVGRGGRRWGRWTRDCRVSAETRRRLRERTRNGLHLNDSCLPRGTRVTVFGHTVGRLWVIRGVSYLSEDTTGVS